MKTLSRLENLERKYADRAVSPILMRFPDGTETLIHPIDMTAVLSAPVGTTFSSPDGKLSDWCVTLAAIADGNSE